MMECGMDKDCLPNSCCSIGEFLCAFKAAGDCKDMNSMKAMMKDMMTPAAPYVDPATVAEWMPTCRGIMGKFKEMSPAAQAKAMGMYKEMMDTNSQTYKEAMPKVKARFVECDKDKDGRLNQAEFMAFKQCEHEANAKLLGEPCNTQEFWAAEYGLCNKICPGKEGVAQEDFACAMVIWGAVMREMMGGMGAKGPRGMKLHHLGAMGGEGLMLKLALAYTGCEFEDCCMTQQDFEKAKAAGQFSACCTLPCMTSADGCEMHMAYPTLRFICASMKGKNGECLYPGNQEPGLRWKIENCVEILGEDFCKKIAGVCGPAAPGDASHGQNFINFLAKDLPDVLECVEALLNKQNTKYLAADCMTLADIIFATFLFTLPYNDMYPNQHIVEAVLRKYPKTLCLAERLKCDFAFFCKK